jgi:hypothetical protein
VDLLVKSTFFRFGCPCWIISALVDYFD